MENIRKYVHPRSFGDGMIFFLGVVLGSLLLYYAYSFYDIRVRHTNLVLGLCLMIYYMGQFRDCYVEQSPDDVEVQSTAEGAVEKRLDVGALRAHPVISRGMNLYGRWGRPTLFLSLTLVSFFVMIYVDFHHMRWMEHGPLVGYSTVDYVVGATIIYLCTDVTIRSFGWIMGAIVPLAFVYGLVGPHLPGVFFHGGMGIEQLLRRTVLGMGGVYGFILEIGATWVAIFLLLAGIAQGYGLLDYLMDVSKEISKVFKSGIIHSAVLASLGFGSITGASAANTATTGSFTIPMMKNQGVDSGYAGGIETVASIGGQLVPPVMGIAAFIMADIIGLPYIEIVRAGLIPAILFYFSVVISVHLLVYRYGWTTERDVKNVQYGVFLDLIWYAIPFAILIYLLAIRRFSPLTAGYYTVLAMLGIVAVKYLVQRGLLHDRLDHVDVSEGPTGGSRRGFVLPRLLYAWGRDTLVGFREGAVLMAPLLVILGAIGVIIAVFIQTGFANRLNTLMITLAGGSIMMLLVLAMIVSLLFGLGMPAPAAYVLVASLAATAMVRFGIPELSAHLFVFYYAMYSSLTPPVGPSTIVAAKLAETGYWDTAVKASRLALPGFIIPFVFVTNNELIFWEFPNTILVTFAILMGIAALCMALVAYDGASRLSSVGRGVYFTLSLLAFFGAFFGLFNLILQVAIGGAILGLIVLRFAPTFPGVGQIQRVFHV